MHNFRALLPNATESHFINYEIILINTLSYNYKNNIKITIFFLLIKKVYFVSCHTNALSL